MYEEIKARLQKIGNAGHNVVSIWECEFRKLLRENPGLENEVCPQLYVKNVSINIRDNLYGCRTKYQLREWYKTFPYISKYGTFPSGHTNAYVSADCHTEYLDKEGEWNVNFFILGTV